MTLTIVATKLFQPRRNQIEAVRLASFRLRQPTRVAVACPEPQLRTDDRFFIIPLDSA
jgi:hypothetical protein